MNDCVSDSNLSQESEWIPCDKLASRWRCSPFFVVDVLNSGELRFRHSWGPEKIQLYFEILDRAAVHSIDLQRWEHTNLNRINELDGSCLSMEEVWCSKEELRQQYTNILKQNKDLSERLDKFYDDQVDWATNLLTCREQITELNSKITTLQSELDSHSIDSPQTKTSTATEVAQENRLQVWKDIHLPDIVKIVIACVLDGPKKRNRSELQQIAQKVLGKAPSKGVLEVLRKALPDEYVTRDAGAPKQD